MADLRRCIGSAKFGIEAHEAPIGDFPAQPSQKDGLGRMCKPHWNQYTKELRKAALARKADGAVAAEEASTESAPAAVATTKAVGTAIPISSLANITIRRAMNKGSSPASTMRAK